jgi:transposase-like protein
MEHQMEEKIKKAAIVAEYLRGGVSYRDLQTKYCCSLGTLHRWVQDYMEGIAEDSDKKATDELVDADLGAAMPEDVKTLQAELRKSRLHNKLLSEIINIAEEELSAPIKKKYGTRQS